MINKKHYSMSASAEIKIDVKVNQDKIGNTKQALLLHFAGVKMEKWYQGSNEWGDWPQSDYIKLTGTGLYRIKGS